jgi:L-amino acid N-acyltransferase YncA
MPRDVLVRQTAEADLPAITAIYSKTVSAGEKSFEYSSN